MNISDIKTRIAALRGQSLTSLSPKQFAEGVAQMESLHQEVANYVAEDAKRNWDGQKLHKEIESIETAWATSQAAPAKTAAKLREDRNKVLHVTKSVVETALKYKGALAEQLKANAQQSALIEELTTNGQGWMSLANKRKGALEFAQRKYAVACEALMIMSNRYKEDMTTVGRHAINLEFKEKLAASPDLQKSLTEAKTPQDILALREQLEGKKPEVPAAAATPKTGSTAAAPAAATTPTQESKPVQPAAPVTENKPAANAAQVVVEDVVRNPRSMTEATEIVRRLSQASAK